MLNWISRVVSRGWIRRISLIQFSETIYEDFHLQLNWNWELSSEFHLPVHLCNLTRPKAKQSIKLLATPEFLIKKLLLLLKNLALKIFYDSSRRFFVYWFFWCFHRNEYFIAQNNSWYAAIDNKSNNSIWVFWKFRKKSEIDFPYSLNERETGNESTSFVDFLEALMKSEARGDSRCTLMRKTSLYTLCKLQSELAAEKSQFNLCFAIHLHNGSATLFTKGSIVERVSSNVLTELRQLVSLPDGLWIIASRRYLMYDLWIRCKFPTRIVRFN